jgi:transposase
MNLAAIETPATDQTGFPRNSAVLDFPTSACCSGCSLKSVLIDLRWRSNSWESHFRRVLIREASLKQEVDDLQARVKYLERQLYARKSEQRFHTESNSNGEKDKRSRGHQTGSKGHGRREHTLLPVRDQEIRLDAQASLCVTCGKPFKSFPGTEDSEVVVLEVQAYRRRYRRYRYIPQCNCTVNPGIITAPLPSKIIRKSSIDISIWIHLLVEKYHYQRPMNRILTSLSEYGIELSAGTIGDGLKRLAPLFEVFNEPIHEKSLQEKWWHADEMRWVVMELIEGKVTYRWWIWVFLSKSTVVYILAPGRDAGVVKDYFEGVEGGFLCVDRYSSYKCFVKTHGGFILVFCWAHVRRDFLDIGKSWSELEAWSLAWVNRIGELFHLNKQRVAHGFVTAAFHEADVKLRQAIADMSKQRETELEDKTLHRACQKALTSLGNHWSGLTVFVDNPHIPMHNNDAEQAQRNNAVGRKNYYGSGSVESGYFTVTMFTLFQTLKLWGINLRTWLNDYLCACAKLGGNAPADISAFLPWNMSPEHLQRYRNPLNTLPDSS